MIFLEIEKVKKYLRVEYDDEDELINQMCLAADQTLRAAGCIRNETYGDKYDLALMMIVAHYYENRGEIAGGGNGLPPGITFAIEQLRNVEAES